MSFALPLAAQLRAAGLPEPVPEFRFAPPRHWRFDWAWPARKLAVEVDGAVWTRGRHTRGRGYEADMRKLNHAVTVGWRVLRFSTAMVASGEAVRTIREAMGEPCQEALR